ncbi:hypothetical protein F5Y17DRAFT_455388 [Xylariaceae sp. FL0594]|nr:hypothetical protein F5Y17DRAFT_455388 [Xylariaceae sp. FL0594]
MESESEPVSLAGSSASVTSKKRSSDDSTDNASTGRYPKRQRKIIIKASNRTKPPPPIPAGGDANEPNQAGALKDAKPAKDNHSDDLDHANSTIPDSEATTGSEPSSTELQEGYNGLNMVIQRQKLRLETIDRLGRQAAKDASIIEEAMHTSLPNGTRSAQLDGGEKLKEELLQTKKELEKTKEDLREKEQRLATLYEDTLRIGAARVHVDIYGYTIEPKYFQLKHHIYNFVWAKFSEKVTSVLPEDVLERYGKISRLPAKKLLRSKRHARFFAQGIIWRVLCDNILDNPFKIWGKVSRLVEALLNQEEAPLGRRELWRTLTGDLLGYIKPDAELIRGWERMLYQDIKPLVRDNVDDDELLADIQEIISQAVVLAKELAQSKSRCIVRREKLIQPYQNLGAQEYDRRWMISMEKSLKADGDLIDFAISPALAERNNSYAEPFETPHVLVKAEVCVGKDYRAYWDNDTFPRH